MHKNWSDKNKTIQKMLGKEDTYKEGINLLIEFRSQLFEQILFSGGYREKTGCDIITTGNELEGEDLAEFSKKLDVDSLYAYAKK